MSDMPELTSVREAHRLDEGVLATYLAGQIGGDFSDLEVLQFEGGQSNPTYYLKAGVRTFVLRKKPPGTLLKSAHAVDREYRVMAALKNSGVPVPKMHFLCEDDSVLGTAFFVMEHMEGRVIVDVQLPSLSAGERSELYEHFTQILAALHQVDLAEVGLEDYGRPGNYYERQISRWTKQYLASQTDDIAAMDGLMEWLPAHIPATDETTLVHGDYRIGNCIIHPTEPRITAVLDWELSTTGHPLGDLGYCCMNYHMSRYGPEGFPAAGSGIPTEEDLIHRYCELTGRDGIENWSFYIVYNLFRSAAITQGVYKRGLDGNASSEHWALRKEDSKATAAAGWKLVQDA